MVSVLVVKFCTVPISIVLQPRSDDEPCLPREKVNLELYKFCHVLFFSFLQLTASRVKHVRHYLQAKNILGRAGKYQKAQLHSNTRQDGVD